MGSDTTVTQTVSLINKWNRVLGENAHHKAHRKGDVIRLPLPHPEIPGVWGQHDIEVENFGLLYEAYLMISEIEAVPAVVADIRRAATTTTASPEMAALIEAQEKEILLLIEDQGKFN